MIALRAGAVAPPAFDEVSGRPDVVALYRGCRGECPDPEFVAQTVQLWLLDSSVQTLYIEPGKPWQNGKEERFNGTVRDECLNRFVFGSIAGPVCG